MGIKVVMLAPFQEIKVSIIGWDPFFIAFDCLFATADIKSQKGVKIKADSVHMNFFDTHSNKGAVRICDTLLKIVHYRKVYRISFFFFSAARNDVNIKIINNVFGGFYLKKHFKNLFSLVTMFQVLG